MKAEHQYFQDLVSDAHSGTLQLPAFQRKWVWKRRDVLRLFDSILKDYPIGNFLLLEASDDLNLSPRPFRWLEESSSKGIQRYVLDGQQRITAGLAIYYGNGPSQYFLDLDLLWKQHEDQDLDLDDSHAVQQFVDDLDEGDGYLQAFRATNHPDTRLNDHKLWSPILADPFKLQTTAEKYIEQNPERDKFINRVIRVFFMINRGPAVPVTPLDADLSVQAITRIFETINTSGQRLTAFEIVVAVLHAQDVNLREEVDTYQEILTYYENMDATGELFLQTIALLARQTPKKSSLPKTITRARYKSHADDAVEILDDAGKFLSQEFGMGLEGSRKLIPYDSMFAPLGISLSRIGHLYPIPSPAKAQAIKKIEKWFVGSVLAQRYSEGQPTTQQHDTRELERWIEDDEASMQPWLGHFRVPSLTNVRPNSAIGRLLRCLISQNGPRDPLNNESVGRQGSAIENAQTHHIFPKAFCEDHIAGWSKETDEADLLLNTMPLTKETNKKWHKMDPSNQIMDIESQHSPDQVRELLAKYFIDAEAMSILKRQPKTKRDFQEFLRAREAAILSHITSKWGFEADRTKSLDDEDAFP